MLFVKNIVVLLNCATICSVDQISVGFVRPALDFEMDVPTGVARYPFPDSFPARRYVERGYNVQYWKEMPEGGHFAAMEQPVLFAEDIRAFAATLA